MATGYSAKLRPLVLEPINSILQTIHNESFTDDDLSSILNKLEDLEKVIYTKMQDNNFEAVRSKAEERKKEAESPFSQQSYYAPSYGKNTQCFAGMESLKKQIDLIDEVKKNVENSLVSFHNDLDWYFELIVYINKCYT